MLAPSQASHRLLLLASKFITLLYITDSCILSNVKPDAVVYDRSPNSDSRNYVADQKSEGCPTPFTRYRTSLEKNRLYFFILAIVLKFMQVKQINIFLKFHCDARTKFSPNYELNPQIKKYCTRVDGISFCHFTSTLPYNNDCYIVQIFLTAILSPPSQMFQG